ncbi:MAG TPA: hypothetical protein VFL30_08685 [Rhodanobacteraceae bacterium]|nr:hypothetical protein [Rhodanobacteraceae bacterium]
MKKACAVLFVLEIVLLGVPVTLVAFFGSQILFWTYVNGAARNPDFAPSALAMGLCCIGLVGFWGLSFRFLSGGGRALRQSPLWLLIAAAIGISMASLVLFMPSKSAYAAFGMIGAFGLPLLIPTLHMAIGAFLE